MVVPDTETGSGAVVVGGSAAQNWHRHWPYLPASVSVSEANSVGYVAAKLLFKCCCCCYLRAIYLSRLTRSSVDFIENGIRLAPKHCVWN